MRIWTGIAVALAAVGGGLFAAGRLIYHEPARAEGPLTTALRAAHQPDDRGQDLKPVFDRFIAEEAPLDQRSAILVANGFDCRREREAAMAATRLICRRPFPGTRACAGFFYYSYRTDAGRTVLTVGTTYRSTPRGDLFGRCTHLEEGG